MTTSRFTTLEEAVLQEISSRYPAHGVALEAQFAAAAVQSRENTGVGFYTHFLVDRAAAPPTPCDRIIGRVWAKVESFNAPMTFLVFVNDGHADCLEGATVADNTTETDLSALRFQLIPP